MVDGDGPPIPEQDLLRQHQDVHDDGVRSIQTAHPITLACPERPYDRLMVRANGTEAGYASHFAGPGVAPPKTKAAASLFVPEVECRQVSNSSVGFSSSTEIAVYFRSTAKCAGPDKQPKPSYLGVDVASGLWCAGPRQSKEDMLENKLPSTFCCAFVVTRSHKSLRLEKDVAKEAWAGSWRSGEGAQFFIPSWKLRRFVREGFLVLPGMIPGPELRGCQRVLTRLLGVPGAVVAGV
jgi:hypothetical protein